MTNSTGVKHTHTPKHKTKGFSVHRQVVSIIAEHNSYYWHTASKPEVHTCTHKHSLLTGRLYHLGSTTLHLQSGFTETWLKSLIFAKPTEQFVALLKKNMDYALQQNVSHHITLCGEGYFRCYEINQAVIYLRKGFCHPSGLFIRCFPFAKAWFVLQCVYR